MATQHESTFLRDCLPPALEEYEIDGLGVQLLPHQKTAIPWMVQQERTKVKRGGILADEQGLGKTLTMISFLQLRKNQSLKRKYTTLIVCPKAVLRQWSAEIETKLTKENPLSFYEYYENLENVEIEHILKNDIVLTTYGKLERALNNNSDADSFFYDTDWGRIVLDEAHIIRNNRGRKYDAAYKLQAKYRWCLTGTPINNGLSDLYTLIDFLRFDMAKVRKPKTLTAKSPALPEIRRDIGKILIRRTKQILDLSLPLRSIHNVSIEFRARELECYGKLIADFSSVVKSFDLTGALSKKQQYKILAKLTRLSQMCVHPFLVEEVPNLRELFNEMKEGLNYEGLSGEERVLAEALSKIGRKFSIHRLLVQLRDGNEEWENVYRKIHRKVIEPSSKTSAILSKLRETVSKGGGPKTLIFSQWTTALDILQYQVEADGYKCCRLEGSMSENAYRREIAQFKTENNEIFLLSVRAASLGLNLVEASQVIFLDQWWNPSVEEQAMDRVHRIGQKSNVHVYFFRVRESIEQDVHGIVEKKKDLISKVLESSRSGDNLLDSAKELCSKIVDLAKLICQDQSKIKMKLNEANVSIRPQYGKTAHGRRSKLAAQAKKRKSTNLQEWENCRRNALSSIKPKLAVVSPIPKIWIGPKYADERLQPLTPEERCLASELVSISSERESLNLGEEELKTLQNDRWVDGDVTNCFANLLNRRSRKYAFPRVRSRPTGKSGKYLRAYMWNTYFYTKIMQTGTYRYNGVKRSGRKASLSIPSLDLILVSIHLNGNHWVLVALQLEKKEGSVSGPVPQSGY